jgi:hypothetical protein
MQVKLEAILYRGVVNFGRKSAAMHQAIAIKARCVGDLQKLCRGLPRMLSTTTTDEQAEFFCTGIQGAFQCTHH